MKRMVIKDCIDGGYLMNRTFTGMEVIQRLGEYEELGYSPEELKTILNELRGLKKAKIRLEESVDTNENMNHEGMNRRDILEKAIFVTSGQRVQDYGNPETSFSVIAQMWEPFLREKCLTPDGNIKLKGEDAAALMALFKLARVATGHDKADNYIDCCGYAACAGELQSGYDSNGAD